MAYLRLRGMGMLFRLFVAFFFFSTAFAGSPIEDRDAAAAAEFLQSLPPQEREAIESAIHRIEAAPNGAVPLSSGSEPAVLLVQGIDFEAPRAAWARPLHRFLRPGAKTVFFKWSKRRSLAKSSGELTAVVRALLQTEPRLEIIGYSAGGILSLLSLDSLAPDPLRKRVSLHTVATPLFGYGASPISVIGSPFAGTGTIEIGRGAYSRLRNLPLEGCEHFVTTKCELDKHACEYRGVFPQRGKIDENPPMPCARLTELSEASHATSLWLAIESIFGR